ncbi:phosphotransferase [Kineococcus sp. NPDC059986]|jgi:Ser/Thr protein kinase RdoA (MazF antagonist)|uniref:phosphotransferase n=1 Tax=Kineococcus sp. NPDC059986 TaxID=3155538 RepID=UPI00344E04FC
MTTPTLPLDLSSREIRDVVGDFYGLRPVAVTALDSELSAVAELDLGSTRGVFKAVRYSPVDLDLARWRVGAVEHLYRAGVPVGRTFRNRDGELVSVVTTGSGPVIAHVSEWLLGVPLEDTEATPALLAHVGETAAAVARGLESWPEPPSEVSHLWDLVRTSETLAEASPWVSDPRTREVVQSAASRFAETVEPVILTLPRATVHHDLHDSNLLTDPVAGVVSGVLDFGDMVEGPRVAELAVAAAYASRGAADPTRAFLQVAQGWGRNVQLSDAEIGVVFDAGIARLAVNAAVWASRRDTGRAGYAHARSQRSTSALTALLGADRARVDSELRQRLGSGKGAAAAPAQPPGAVEPSSSDTERGSAALEGN